MSVPESRVGVNRLCYDFSSLSFRRRYWNEASGRFSALLNNKRLSCDAFGTFCLLLTHRQVQASAEHLVRLVWPSVRFLRLNMVLNAQAQTRSRGLLPIAANQKSASGFGVSCRDARYTQPIGQERVS
jgi:hypothetical protein